MQGAQLRCWISGPRPMATPPGAPTSCAHPARAPCSLRSLSPQFSSLLVLNCVYNAKATILTRAVMSQSPGGGPGHTWRAGAESLCRAGAAKGQRIPRPGRNNQERSQVRVVAARTQGVSAQRSSPSHPQILLPTLKELAAAGAHPTAWLLGEYLGIFGVGAGV